MHSGVAAAPAAPGGLMPPLAWRAERPRRHVCVDEFQDTNTSQYELVKLLTLPRVRHGAACPLAAAHACPTAQAVRAAEGSQQAGGARALLRGAGPCLRRPGAVHGKNSGHMPTPTAVVIKRWSGNGCEWSLLLTIHAGRSVCGGRPGSSHLWLARVSAGCQCLLLSATGCQQRSPGQAAQIHSLEGLAAISDLCIPATAPKIAVPT